MRKLMFISVAFSMLLTGCGPSGTNVSGVLENAEGETVLLERLSSTKGTPIDSCEVNSNGEFDLHAGKEIKPGFYRLSLDPKNFVILLLEDGQQAAVTGNALDFYKSYNIEGSDGSKKLRELDLVLRSDYEKTDSLRKVFQAFQQQGHPRLDSIAEDIDAQFKIMKDENREFIIKVIDENPGSLVSLSAVQSLNPEVDFEFFQKVADDLNAVLPKSEYLKQFKVQIADMKARAQANKRTGIGAEAPEMIMSTPDGNTIKLSDFRGKVTMIDFWASWCKPCRMENPNVVRVYNRFKDKGFEIFGVSLDQDGDQWIQAIAQDGLTWKHGSELKFWQSSFVPTYNLDGIPMTYLLDENGVIIAKGLRGAQLEQKLEELFNS